LGHGLFILPIQNTLELHQDGQGSIVVTAPPSRVSRVGAIKLGIVGRLIEAFLHLPLNQLRVVGWKFYEGVLISNNQFFCRIESTSAFSQTFG
jgi:hypothetical protein